MNYNLIGLRVKAFFIELGSTLFVILLAFVFSPEFAAIVTEHWGQGAATILSTLLAIAAAKHGYNINKINSSQLGSEFKTARDLL